MIEVVGVGKPNLILPPEKIPGSLEVENSR